MYVRKYTLFSTFHPAVLLFFALGAPVLSMVSYQAGFAVTALVMSFLCHWFYYGIFSTVKRTAVMLPFLLLIAVLNMVSNPRGDTVLLVVGHRLFTLESFGYGLVSAAVLMAVLIWFGCFSAVIDHQKFLYLFGRRFPGLALLLSMILKLFPETGYKIECMKRAQSAGVSESPVSRKEKLSGALCRISILLEWSMEDSIETADSMKARGYGGGTRGQYEQYRMSSADAVLLAVMTVLAFAVVMGLAVYPEKNISCTAGVMFFGLPLWIEAGGSIQRAVRETKIRRRKEYETVRNE